MTRTLIASAEAKRPRGGAWFGYEVFDLDEDFFLIIHTRTYEGIRVASHYATPETKLAALTKDEALHEAARKTATYSRAVTGDAS